MTPRFLPPSAARRLTRFLAGLCAVLLLCACASTPPPPEWQANAHSALQSFTDAYLSGNTRVADADFNRAKAELARTGRPDLMARAELTRCAVRMASLEWDACAAYAPFAQDATPQEQAYAAYLAGRWTDVNPVLLPAHHQALVLGVRADKDHNNRPIPANRLIDMPDPLAQLVAAGVLLRTGHITPAEIMTAVDTASAQGWRRPLLTWLGVQRQQTLMAGDADMAARLQRRMDLIAAPK